MRIPVSGTIQRTRPGSRWQTERIEGAGVFTDRVVCGGQAVFESLDIRHWLVIAVLILINVAIFGCVILILANKVALPFG